MTKNLDKEGLSSIADNYQLFYVDLWGVVHNGVTLHLEAIKALKEINKKKKDYILLTNAPRPNHAVKSFLEKLGMEKEIRDHVFTSGEAALIYLKKNLINKTFFHVGPPRDFDLFKDFEKMKSNQIEKWLKIEAERFRMPVFRLFHTELETVYEEKNRALDSDGSKMFEALMSGLFPNHQYGTQTTIGTINHLKNPSLKEIRKYYNKY